jgi:DNA primase
MYFSSDFIDVLREQIRVSDVVGQKVKLQQRGKEYYGLCPFHQEHTPSFTVNNDKKFYHCFGCGAHGDIVKFTMETKGLDFVEAVKILAQEHGIALPAKQSAKEIDTAQKLSTLYQVTACAAKWFNEKLFSTQGLQALRYINNRGIFEDAIKKFNIGFSPDTPDALYKFLLSQSITLEQMLEVGLVIESKGQVFDRFRNRVIFPIYDNKSRIIGFGGRLLGESATSPKYLNSPETLLFKKGHNFYAENIALVSGQKDNPVVIVEGYMDVIALNIVGIDNVVATLGTAITEEHIRKVWRYCPNPIVCMDGDKAGIRAMERSAKLALALLKPGHSLQFVKLPNGNDPDDTIKNFGKSYLQDLLKRPISLSEILWEIELDKIDATTPEQKALLQKNLMDLAEQIAHPTVKQFYRKFFNDKLWKQFNSYGISRRIPVNKPINERYLINVRNLSSIQKCELALIALIIEYPILLKDSRIFDSFIMIDSKIDFASEIYRTVEEVFNSVNMIEGTKELSNEFKKLINDKISPTQLNFLCGDNSYFIDKISIKEDNDILRLWEEAFNSYNLELLKEEYKKAMQGLDDKSMQLALTLQNEIMKLEQQIKVKSE